MQNIALVILTKKFIFTSTAGLGVLALTVDPMIFATAAVLVIGAIATAAGVVIKALSSAKIELLEKQAELFSQGKVTQGHVDGMTTAAAAKRTADEDTIISLKQQLAEAQKVAALLAQAKTNLDIAAASAVSTKGKKGDNV